MKLCTLDLHPDCCWEAPIVRLWDGPGHVLAGVCKESPALLGAGTGTSRSCIPAANEVVRGQSENFWKSG